VKPARRHATYEDLCNVPEQLGAGPVRAEPFEAVELDMRRWWGEV